MSNIVPFTAEGLPANIVSRTRKIDVNKDIVTSAPYPSLSIKGKVFALVQDSERRVLTKPDDPDEVVQAVNMAFLRINMDSKTFYKKKYSEEDSEGARPDCYSLDGKRPSPQSPEPQSNTCASCPHNQWGSRVSDDATGKGKACADHARIAIADPRRLEKPMLLRVPPASLKPLKDCLKAVKTRQVQYNEVVFRVGFDREAPSPKLTFKPVGVLDDETYDKACEMFESEVVRSIVGLDEPADAAPAPAAAPVEADELDAALAKRGAARAAPAAKVSQGELDDVTDPPAPAPAPAPKPPAKKAAPKPTPAAEPAPAPAPATRATVAALPGDGDDLIGDLDSLLGGSDD